MHAPILKRVGGVLILVGLLDMTVMIYCIVNDISYSSSFNIFAVIAGIFLLRGSLRAATVVRWFAVFMLAGFTAFLVAWPFLQPFSLTLMQLRLNPWYAAITIIYIAFFFGLLFWLAKELGRAPIQAAIIQAGRKSRDMRIPAAVGVGLVVVLGIFLTVLLGGESARRVKSMAEQQIGPGYRFHVSSLTVAKNNRRTIVSGVVTAWNDNEIKSLPVHWKEP
jgi:hypothetical protein